MVHNLPVFNNTTTPCKAYKESVSLSLLFMAVPHLNMNTSPSNKTNLELQLTCKDKQIVGGIPPLSLSTVRCAPSLKPRTVPGTVRRSDSYLHISEKRYENEICDRDKVD